MVLWFPRVILLRVLRKINSRESQICNSVGPCSRHRELHIAEINSDQSQISKKTHVIYLEIHSPTTPPAHVIFFCVDRIFDFCCADFGRCKALRKVSVNFSLGLRGALIMRSRFGSFSDLFCVFKPLCDVGDSFCNPNPHKQGKI